MNILVVTPYPPVLHVHGGGVRMYHNIRLLSERHSVRVISFVMDDEEAALLNSVEPVCENVTAVKREPDFGPHWFSLAPFLVREFGGAAMHKAMDDAVRAKSPDVIQCEYLQMAQYRRAGIFSILTIHETYSPNAYRAFEKAAGPLEKLQMFSRWMAMMNYEIAMCNAFDRVVTMTEDDARFLRSYARRANIRAIPIGIDADSFRPPQDESPAIPVEIVFVGNYRHPPNVEAAEFLVEEVAPHFPEIRFVIAGSYLPESVRRPPNAVFPGYIPDTRQLFHGPSTIFLAPLFSGTGQRVKLLEAFAMGAAVVTTPLGAAGFDVESERQAVIANTPAEFREAVARLAASRDLRVRLGREAREMIVDRFTWDKIAPEFWNVVRR